MNTASTTLLESFAFKFPKSREIFSDLGINGVVPIQHSEHAQIMSNFSSPTFIVAIGMCAELTIVQRESKLKYNCLDVGSEVMYYQTTKGKLSDKIVDSLFVKDFIPNPLVRKVAFLKLPQYDGRAYTCVSGKKFAPQLFDNIADISEYNGELEGIYSIVKREVGNLDLPNEA